MLIISMMIDDIKVCCGPICTTFIINDVIYRCDYLRLVPSEWTPSEKTIGKIYHEQDYTIFIEKSKKTIYCWGSNEYGQLGLGDNDGRYNTLQKIMFDFRSKIASVACGDNNILIVTELGEMYGWGNNANGQLGLGNKNNHNSPQKLPLTDVKLVSCGSYHTIIVTSVGCGYACGWNTSGQLGLGDYIDRNSPHKLDLLGIISISCGRSHTIALTSNGIYSWGDNTLGQLGLGERNVINCCKPQKIDLLNSSAEEQINISKYSRNSYVISISCGNDHTMILTIKGELFVCGNNHQGQLGLGRSAKNLFGFQKLNWNEFTLSVNCGNYHTIITTKSGKYYGCGCNEWGQLGVGDTQTRYEPTEIVIKM